MLKSKRTVLEVLFPEVRAKVLRLLFSAPQKQRYVRELMRMSGLALHTVQDELRKLSAVRVVTSWSKGKHHFYQANRDHPLYPQLLRIVQLSDKLPRVKHTEVHRPEARRGAKTHRPKMRPLPVDRPVSWHLFSPPDKL